MTLRQKRRTGMPVTVLIVGVVAMTALASCRDGVDAAVDSPVELIVTVQEWTGSQADQPEARTTNVTVEVGDAFDIATIEGGITVTVVRVDDREIEFETSQAMAPRGDGGGINLNEGETTFVLERDGSVEFATPTMDAGTTITLRER